MIEISQKTVKQLIKAAKNKNNTIMKIVTKKLDGATELGSIILGKERADAVNFLKGILPENTGKVFCTFT